MSDLLSGEVGNERTQNGGSRAGGSVPQPFAGGERVRTPTDIMRTRRDREARKQAEKERLERERQEEERQRYQEEENMIPDSAPGAAGVAENKRHRRSGDPRRSVGDPALPDTTQRRSGERTTNGNTRANIPSTAQPAAYNPANGRNERNSALQENADLGNLPVPKSRSRGASLSTGQPRPVDAKSRQPRAVSATATAGNTRDTSKDFKNASFNTTAGTSQARQGTRATSQPMPESTAGPQSRNTNSSSFPHAFERWETLSSHWEGLTSFWLRRLEQNKEDLDGNPINQQMARQVTDLSAAGANLFHAVVELQRLRASSERKFQRWFFETRAEQERFRENQSKFDERIRNEQAAATEAQTALARLQKERNSALSDKGLASRQVDEMRRELDIAKKEARRAWEELGRREQEERDRTISLKQGQVTIVGGVQVVPMIQSASRQGSTNRPTTRDGPPGAATSVQASHVDIPADDEAGYTTFDPARSETDTDPFAEGGRANAPQGPYRDNDRPTASSTSTSTVHPYNQTSNTSAAAVQAARAATSSSPQQSIPQQQVRSAPNSSAPSGTYLRYGPDGPSSANTQPGSTSFYQHEGISLQGQPRVTEADEHSYVPSVEDTVSEEDYELNENGEVRRDAQGRPIQGNTRRLLGSEDSDEYDVQDQLERERMYGRSYGSAMSGVEYGGGTAATTDARQTASQEAPVAADYTGSGFGAGWEAMPRHHHPTRLSDVLEEDERSRTSPSRASQNSRGIR